ncbi:MAG TPA: tol-pal system protein YbgF [Nitrospira sp.]|nr:tol-pal system protein YbgF [Nitrospira sp.]
MTILAQLARLMRLLVVLAAVTGSWSVTAEAVAPASTQEVSRRLYDRVMDEFRRRDYEAALAGFRLFVEIHGESSLAGNAQYWMGECQYRLRHYRDALETFYTVISHDSASAKVPVSTLRIGQIYGKLGDKDKARLMYERVVDQYPDSPEAEVARQSLAKAGPRSESDVSSRD